MGNGGLGPGPKKKEDPDAKWRSWLASAPSLPLFRGLKGMKKNFFSRRPFSPFFFFLPTFSFIEHTLGVKQKFHQFLLYKICKISYFATCFSFVYLIQLHSQTFGTMILSHRKLGLACVYFGDHITTEYNMYYATYCIFFSLFLTRAR